MEEGEEDWRGRGELEVEERTGGGGMERSGGKCIGSRSGRDCKKHERGKEC